MQSVTAMAPTPDPGPEDVRLGQYDRHNLGGQLVGIVPNQVQANRDVLSLRAAISAQGLSIRMLHEIGEVYSDLHTRRIVRHGI
jgi:hypothetical protein